MKKMHFTGRFDGRSQATGLAWAQFARLWKRALGTRRLNIYFVYVATNIPFSISPNRQEARIVGRGQAYYFGLKWIVLDSTYPGEGVSKCVSRCVCALACACERIGIGFATVTSDATGNDVLYAFGGASPTVPSGLNDLLRCVQHARARA
jgi:hypothetical protein